MNIVIQTVSFDWCTGIIPYTTVCKRRQVYNVTLLQHSTPMMETIKRQARVICIAVWLQAKVRYSGLGRGLGCTLTVCDDSAAEPAYEAVVVQYK